LESIKSFLDLIDGYLGSATYFPILLLGTGIIFTIYLGLPQVRYFSHAIRILKGKYTKDGKVRPIPGSNLTLATLGTFILWMGWFGFNGGSQLAMGSKDDINAIAMVIADTNMAACAGAIMAAILTQVIYKKVDLTMVLNGALAGLVSVTAGPDLGMIIAFIVGSVGGILVVIAVPLSIGITNAIRAIALMLGPVMITNWVNKDNLTYIFIFQGCAVILWGFLQFNFYIALFAVFLTGFVTTTIWAYTYALLQDKVEKKYLGRVISYNDMIFMLSNVCTTLFIGICASFLPLDIITIIIGSSFFLVALYYKRIQQWI